MQKQLLNKKTSLDEVVYFVPYEVPLPHYSVRPMRFGSRGLSEFPGRCRQITFFLRLRISRKCRDERSHAITYKKPQFSQN